jgi:Mn2+/Fe2+ NRAMP family transporter
LLLMALAGAGANPLGNLKYAAFVHEKGWRDPSYLPSQRVDLLLSVLGMFAMTALMQVAAAGTLRPLGVPVEDAEHLVPMFSQAMGEGGRIVLGVGLWAVVFTSYIGSTTGSCLILSDIYRNFIRPSKNADGKPTSPDGAGSQSAFRGFLLWICLSPLYGLATDWKPIGLLLLVSALLVVLVPILVLVLLRLTNDKKLMGDHINGWVTNTALAFVILAAAYLTYQNAIEFWTNLKAAF